jgi:glycosyltransferase involved in cell wall biosynthesis
MRILHLVQRYAPFRGGSELVFGELSERLAAAGHQVTVYTTDAWDLEHFWRGGQRRIAPVTEFINGVAVVRWPVRHLPLGQIAYPVLRRAMTHLTDLPGPAVVPLLERLGRFSPWTPELAHWLAARETVDAFDIVHACNVTLEGLLLAARDYARRAALPLVVTPFLHLGDPATGRVGKYYAMQHQNSLLRRADAVVAMTQRERSALLDRGVSADRILVTGVGVDPDSVLGGDGPRFREQHGLDAAPIVFSLGANAYDKGMVHLVEAVQRLWEDGRDVNLVLAGPRLRHFDHFIAQLPAWVRQRLRVLGPIDDQVRRDLFAAGSVFAMPSRTDSFGIVYLEAWACGLPVIGARAGAIPEVIRDGIDGRLIAFGDVPALAQAIAGLIQDPAGARLMGAAGRATLAERSWPCIASDIEARYAALVAEARATPVIANRVA